MAGDAFRSRVILPRLGPLPRIVRDLCVFGSQIIRNLDSMACHHVTIPGSKKILDPAGTDAVRARPSGPAPITALVFPAAVAACCCTRSFPTRPKISCAFPATSCRFCARRPKEAEIVSHRLMLRAGMIRQEAAGIYAFLPLGLRVLEKVCRIVREEQDRSGAIELLMPTIQSADLWRESGRYEAYGKEMLRIKDRHERDMLYGPTNEEMITEIFRSYVRSYKDLPLNLYHIQWKFRDEVRPRFGLMRGREFLMKDAYSFDLDFAGARHAYNRMFVAYLRTFARMGLRSIPMVAESGPIGGNLSPRIHHSRRHRRERGVLPQRLSRFRGSRAGRGFRHMSAGCRRLWTSGRRSMRRPRKSTTRRPSTQLPRRQAALSARGIEVGHIFYFGTKYSEPMKAVVDRPRRRRPAGPHGLLRHRPEPAGRRHHRGLPRRRRHQMAGGRGAVQGHDPQSQAGRQPIPTRPASSFMRELHRQGHRHALSRPRRAAGREIRHAPI